VKTSSLFLLKSMYSCVYFQMHSYLSIDPLSKADPSRAVQFTNKSVRGEKVKRDRVHLHP
jgi:hypothetical protein